MAVTVIRRADVAQAPSHMAAYRAAIADGTATVLQADRKVNRNQADVRNRADQDITVRRAIRAIELRRLGSKAYRVAYPEGITGEMVRDVWGYESPNAIARGDLRAQYFTVLKG